MTTTEKEILEDSIDELLEKVYNRAVELAYMPDLMTLRDQPLGMSDLLWDDVWAYSDGLVQQRIFNVLGGSCSVKTLLAFDLEDEEKQLKEDLETFNSYTPGSPIIK